MEQNQTLDPIEPRDALQLYLREKATENVSQQTVKAHKYRLGHFMRWSDEKGIDNLNILTGRLLKEYRLWRTEEGGLNAVSVKTQMDTLRVFTRWCEAIDAVEKDLSEKVQSPTLNKGDNQRDVLLEADRAQAVLAHLSKYHYASLDHALIATLWHCGLRIGAAHSLDVGDVDHDRLVLDVKHRPPETTLKNKEEGERLVTVNHDLSNLLSDWVGDKRPDVEDSVGRTPLFATSHGRAHKTTLRAVVNKWTRPCAYTGECPHAVDMKECEGRDDHKRSYYKCPSAVSPHAIRRGRITHLLSNDVPVDVVSGHVNADPEVIKKWYDRRSEGRKAEQRRDFLEGL